MIKMNGIELFTKLYNDEITDDECIKVIHPAESDHYILRTGCTKRFDTYELLSCLLYQEYKFEIKNQSKVETYLEKKNKQKRIAQLEKELQKLKGGEKQELEQGKDE